MKKAVIILERVKSQVPPAATVKAPRRLRPMPIPAEQSKKARARNARRANAAAWCNVCGLPMIAGKKHRCSGEWEA